MNDNDRKIFEAIKEKAKQDKEIWNEAQKVQNLGLTPEKEEAVIERMFLLHFTERYLEQQETLDIIANLECSCGDNIEIFKSMKDMIEELHKQVDVLTANKEGALNLLDESIKTSESLATKVERYEKALKEIVEESGCYDGACERWAVAKNALDI